MGDHSEVFVALDVAKGKNAVAIAEGGRRGEVRYLGEIENSRDATRKLVAKLCKTYQRLTFCYEAGPTGYGALQVDPRSRARLHCCGAVVDPVEARRSCEDQ